MVSFLNTYVVSILAIAALTVLTAMGKVEANTAVPLIVALAGVHVGSTLSSTPTPTEPAVYEKSSSVKSSPTVAPPPPTA